MTNYNILGKVVNASNVYNCTDYGITSESVDNTRNFQALIDLVYDNGGGTIFVPVGTYIFDVEKSARDWTGTYVTTLLGLKSGVSIIGESLTNTVLKVIGTTQQGCTLFSSNHEYQGELLVGATYSNFTIDMRESSLVTYTHKAKAFYTSGMKDCILRDIICLGTPSTSIGIDMLDNVVIDSLYVYQGGRQWEMGGPGGAGIGIGSGKWENENYIIRNCICDECGHFGIFIEDQGLFDKGKRNFPKGQIISNNIVRNGRNYGIGLRGGKNVLITGNTIYENVGGLYVDYGAEYCMFSNNLCEGNIEAGFCYGDESKVESNASYVCDNIIVSNNSFMNNGIGIQRKLTPATQHEFNNIFIGNAVEIE